MYPTLIDLGTIFSIHIGIHSYGVMLATAFITCSVLLQRELNRRGFQGDIATTIVVAGAIGGIVGAKFYYVLFVAPAFSIRELFSPTGLVWYGGLIGGSVAVGWVIHRSSNPFLPTVDIVGPLLLLGYGIGRIGCLLAGDGDYGPASDVPWAMAFPNGTVPTTEKVHPTPIYETSMSVLFFGILWSQRKKTASVPGLLFGISLVMIAVERFIAEFWRLTPRVFPDHLLSWLPVPKPFPSVILYEFPANHPLSWLTSPQLVSVILFCFGIIFIYYMYQRPRVAVETEVTIPEPEKETPRLQKRRRRR